ncbi:hypothetical protein [Trichloromonas sp.]|uniref:hypothetical protein n=1 Tax=Trichloromonas sp. TaxID=3069249 RepID=UPI002A4DB61F|nr:hypothetical protein [Trichloromonas sp.]
MLVLKGYQKDLLSTQETDQQTARLRGAKQPASRKGADSIVKHMQGWEASQNNKY